MNHKLLWVDDDDPDRFTYTANVLKRKGWEIEFVGDVATAAGRLSAQEYGALLIDQMFPFRANDVPNVWSGCVLLYWLRGRKLPRGLGTNLDSRSLSSQSPLKDNARLRVAVVTAFDRERTVKETMEKVKRNEDDLVFIIKPLITDEVDVFLSENGS